MNEPSREELSERYEQMTDSELEALHPSNLTEVALEAYKAELLRRNKTEHIKLLEKEEENRQNILNSDQEVEADKGSKQSDKGKSPSVLIVGFILIGVILIAGNNDNNEIKPGMRYDIVNHDMRIGFEMKRVPNFDLSTACGREGFMEFLINNELEITARDKSSSDALIAYTRYYFMLVGRHVRRVWNSIQC